MAARRHDPAAVNEYNCARQTKKLFSGLREGSRYPWILQNYLELVGTGKPCCRIILRLDGNALNGHTIFLVFSIERDGNYRQQLEIFEPSDCDVHMSAPDGETFRNALIGYPDGTALFRGDLNSLVEQLIGEVHRLQNITREQLNGEDEPPPYAMCSVMDDDDLPPPYA